jgi:serine/threonine protein kinase/Tfp pilus assembly protein PilF
MKNTLPLRVRFGVFELDLKSGELHKSGQRVVLQEQPLQILRILLEHAGEIANREEIQQQLWPNDTVVEFDHSINAAIKKLRVALGDSADNPKYIETVARRGYRLMVRVERLDSTAGDTSSTGVVSSSHDGTGVQLPLEAAGLTGKTVSHYRVLEVVGGGGMGVVYKAEDLKLGRAVALKFLPEEVGNDPRALERFEREARAASSLDHPNICAIYEFGEHEGRPFIVMQLLQGQTLRDCLSSGALKGPASETQVALDRLLNIAIQIANGLEAAHEQGIVHRDIKPANIFITTKGVAKILDFGLAKLPLQPSAVQAIPAEIGGKQALNPSRPVRAAGTAAYMSPEQARGQQLDARTDLFSFGLILYEMATGRRAFTGDNAAAMHDAILNRAPTPPAELNTELPTELQDVIQKCLEKDRDLRYQHAAEVRSDLEKVKRRREHPLFSRWRLLATAAVIVVALLAGGLYWRSRHATKLTEKDTIVLSDFTNSTGDSVFDDTLKQGLSIQLEQSPFLVLVSERKVNGTLKLMGRPAGDRLTPDVTREVCQRTGSKAMVIGSIVGLGSQYVIGLKAVNCDTGDVLAEAQEPAAGKEAVLKALDAAAVSLRGNLGESLSSVQKYATPLVEATTPSLEALKAYSLGRKTRYAKSETAALPFYKRAVEIDPNFALPYTGMAAIYNNLNEVGQAAENARKAYDLREKVSERERFSIEGYYYLAATGELEKAAQVYEQWQQAYPRDFVPYGNLGYISSALGNWEKTLEESRDALRLEPNSAVNAGNVGVTYASLNRLDEAEAVYQQAEERKLHGELLLQARYQLAFLKGDAAQMAQLVSAAMGKPGAEGLLLAAQADTEAWYGKLKNARELTRRAMDSAGRNDAKEAAATYQAAAALREVESGNREQAGGEAEAAVKLAPNRDVRAMAALALARAGDTPAAEKLADELDKTYPLGTLVQRYWLPTIRAAVALQRKDPNRAVELLNRASTIELGQPANLAVSLCPAYLRGEAYLMLHDGNAAAAEFRKFIEHYGLVANFPWGALARLGLARAYVLDAATDPAARDKARAAYQDFFALWKDADPDIPILHSAKAEYAKLK